ncbi:MAG: P-loop NTPase [Firmicutes bacterium]|nr:P-loop NTPase [Bacillota bacterium]
MIITVASGKGGTGKTTVAVNMALSLDQKEALQFLDCDVEEPNAHFFLKPDISSSEPVSIPVPNIDEAKCTFCGRCSEVCAFNAIAVLIDHVMTFPELCHGCGGCSYFCPEKAISEVPREIGLVEKGKAKGINFLHGRLNPREAMSPPLIKSVKDHADRDGTVIIDAPPGTSCPVVTSVKGSDFCLLVTEPTPFGLNDLQLAVQMLKKMDIPAGVLINRSDIGDSQVEDYCQREGLPTLLKLPWNKELARLYARGEPIVRHSDGWKNSFQGLWAKIREIVEDKSIKRV